ncbi:MAG TPA: hypothetical protein VHG28_23230 [Longimicrobiaceae bacterium]|nr:hypothetical protein [Longimicrobiaceae bacterium]
MGRGQQEGAGRSGTERGTSQFSESSSRKEAEQNTGEAARGLTDTQHETRRNARESAGRSRDTPGRGQ